ncbi:MAG: PEGA domain-containing protein, partial [Ignavibacteriaceae bacterium]
MKKPIILFIIPFIVLLITSCNTTDDPVTTDPGSIYVTSNPAGAQIWIDGVNTSQVTPDTIKNLDEGVYNVTLKLADYNDATFSVSVTSGQTIDLTNVVLVSNLMKTLYGPVKIYESFGTTSSEPSGLDLSSGNAWGVSSDSSGLVDIYYFSD